MAIFKVPLTVQTAVEAETWAEAKRLAQAVVMQEIADLNIEDHKVYVDDVYE